MVFVPEIGNDTGIWVSLNDCIWQAPEYLTVRHQLSSTALYGNNQNLRVLFTKILKVTDAKWSDYVDQLKSWVQMGSTEDVNIDIYCHLMQAVCDESEWEVVR